MDGRDPYCVWNDLDSQFVPFEGGEPEPPPYASRHHAVLAAFGRFEVEQQMRLAGAKVPGDDERKRRRAEQ